MHRMRKRFLPIAHIGRAQDTAHGGVTAQMSRVQSQLQSALKFENTFAHAHRSQAVRMQYVRQSVPSQLRSTKACVDAYNWR